MKLMFLGDSLTEGRYGGDFVAEIARLMPSAQVVNRGVSGSTAINLLERLDQVIAEAPDAVFLMIGGNDSISHSQPGTRPYYKANGIPDGHVTPDMYATAYREILSRLQMNFIQTWVGLPPMEYSRETVNMQREFNAIAAHVARSMNVSTLDFMAHVVPEGQPIADRPPIDISSIRIIGQRTAAGWQDYEAERQQHGFTYTFDGIHILPETARTFAQLIHQFITDD